MFVIILYKKYLYVSMVNNTNDINIQYSLQKQTNTPTNKQTNKF